MIFELKCKLTILREDVRDIRNLIFLSGITTEMEINHFDIHYGIDIFNTLVYEIVCFVLHCICIYYPFYIIYQFKSIRLHF